MTFELGTFDVSDVVLGDETRLSRGVLTVDADEIRSRVLASPRFADVSVHIAKPGESARIHNVLDIVEPRFRCGNPDSDFPGMVAAPQTVGRGRTHRLSGVSVCLVSQPVPGEPEYWRQAIFDTNGPGAQHSPFGSLVNIALVFEPNHDQFSGPSDGAYDVLSGNADVVAYNDAIRRIGLEIGVYLAAASASDEPDDLTRYEISLLSRDDDRPRVVYFYQGRPYVYGKSIRIGSGGRGELPTLIHPNEVLDGAVINSWAGPACHRDVTYLIQNHPVILDLYARHGTSLDFAGVVMYDRGDDAVSKERNAYYAANLALALEADGAILTYLGSGHSIVDVMMVCELLERRGTQTVLILPEMAADPQESGLADFVPEARSIISTGNYEQPIHLPAVETVIGGETLLETGEDASGALDLTLRSILASTDPFGYECLRATEW